jgi:dipeptidyl aminopeptidase/acylaminoacyl peptidase
MKGWFVFYFIMLTYENILSQQKPVIDSTIIGTWPTLNKDATISNNGHYVAFTIENKPYGGNTLVVKEIKGSWKKEFISNKIGTDFYFTTDSKGFCWQNGDSLFLQAIGKDSYSLIGIVDQCKFPSYEKGRWIAFQSKNRQGEETILDLLRNSFFKYQNVKDVVFDDDGKTLLLLCNEENKTILKWIELEGHKTFVIWEGDKNERISNYQFDKSGNKLAFIVKNSNNSILYYYNKETGKVIRQFDSNNNILGGQIEISKINGFSKNGKWLFLKLKGRKKQIDTKRNSDMASVDVWSYREEVLHPQQSFISSKYTFFDLAINILDSTNRILLNQDGLLTVFPKQITDIEDYVLLSSDTIEDREYWWPYSPKANCWLVSLGKYQKIKLPAGFDAKMISISPMEQWLIGWVRDNDQYDFYSYEIKTGKLRNITKALPNTVAMEKMGSVDSFPVGIGGWFKNDEALLIYDNYDIWKIDPRGELPANNLTYGFGFHNHIKLRIAEDEVYSAKVYGGAEKLLLTAYDENNKNNGFFQLDLGGKKKLVKLIMSPFSWYKTQSQTGNSANGSNTLLPPKSFGKRNDRCFLLMGESVTEYPNYYCTKDFKTFIRLSDLEPQKAYNWLTTELVTWKMYDGQISQGILYKPENFDSTRKYPIIFNYYERFSGWMYSFLEPDYVHGEINVPWFVSRGYLVFRPDVYFSVGSKTGISNCEHAFNSIESAAKYLSSRSYIDTNHMGIEGHSFGGLLTNYLLTHSKKYAAAAEVSGFSDEMSSYLTLIGSSLNHPLDNMSPQSRKELNHGLYGTTPWNVPELFRKNSPVWDADKANAPLLILHNKNDEQVQWRQGVEMFMALRRLGKPCWMLQYDNGTHGVDGKDAKDFTIRLTQYFDHYLKDEYPPRWMTDGIPFEYKQIEERYELDTKGNCNNNCRSCKKINENRFLSKMQP